MAWRNSAMDLSRDGRAGSRWGVVVIFEDGSGVVPPRDGFAAASAQPSAANWRKVRRFMALGDVALESRAA
jgi:hypothetical protein